MAVDLRSPKTQVVLLAVLAGILLTWLFYAQVYSKNLRTLQSLRGDLQKIESEVKAARAAVDQLPEVRREYELTLRKWEKAKDLLPSEKEIPDLIRTMTNAAAESGVRFVSFKPSPPVAEPMYQRIPVTVSVTGNYHQVGSFLAQVANLPRIIKPSDLTLAPNSETKDASRTVKADFTATAFVFKEGGR